ncbi:unnamed protein product [Protopolystoma xenopodis]|uniref:RNA polymerase III subunit Rpc25 domain-containing protein n=1 Tax=Protopolystoma xenopodis TaxID=117903 RepID=A0A448XNT5_9PLAT|nr:unnamed protein product [Protopolystoma xenopodis]
MYILVGIVDTLVIEPKHFGSDMKEIIEAELNSRFSNKVVFKVGLFISLWDILKIEESFISPSDGSYNTVVHFRFVVFRPFIDEVLLGTVKSCSREGVSVSLSFFDDILIPADKMRHPSRFDFDSSSWIWQYSYENETADLPIEKNDTIRFRVVDEIWTDPNPDGGPANLARQSSDSAIISDASGKIAPYTIIASIVTDGLGLTCWWIN